MTSRRRSRVLVSRTVSDRSVLRAASAERRAAIGGARGASRASLPARGGDPHEETKERTIRAASIRERRSGSIARNCRRKIGLHDRLPGPSTTQTQFFHRPRTTLVKMAPTKRRQTTQRFLFCFVFSCHEFLLRALFDGLVGGNSRACQSA